MRIEAGTDLINYIELMPLYGGSLITNCAGDISEWAHPNGYRSVKFIPDECGDGPVVMASGYDCMLPGISIQYSIKI